MTGSRSCFQARFAGVPFYWGQEDRLRSGADQLLYFSVLPVLVHGGVPGEQNVSLCLDLQPQLSVQHLLIGVVHGHVGRAKDDPILCLTCGKISRISKQ